MVCWASGAFTWRTRCSMCWTRVFPRRLSDKHRLCEIQDPPQLQHKTKARHLSESSLLLQKLPMVSLRREQRVTVFPWRLLRQPHSTASPKQSLLGRTLVKEPWLWTPPPFHFSFVMPRVRCPPAPLAVAISFIRQPHEVSASRSRLSAPSG